ncbi:hypothetical protein [Streptomyces sp. NRRL WC-3742]|uniref:hypothetical protein n=1 Tax=Streptomyces sp. NRRL WC-3742 TaxID=1463934 RepID=UPI000AA5AFFB|nr:hypothetical protein [Streptomyces sp. NRRL WC-3742]
MDESEETLQRLSQAIGPMPADLTAKVKQLIQQATAEGSAAGNAHGDRRVEFTDPPAPDAISR